MLAQFWPSSGHTMTENGGSEHYLKKVFMQSNSNFVCTLIEWVVRIDSNLGHVGQIMALLWSQNDWKWLFTTIMWKSI